MSSSPGGSLFASVFTLSLGLLAGPALAGVSVTPLNRPFTPGQVIDINGDGRLDLELFAIEAHEGPDSSAYHWYHSYAYGRERSEISLVRLSAGDLIGPNLPWGSVLRTSGSEHRHGEGGFYRWLPESPTSTEPSFFGIRFNDVDGGLHYAWARYELYDIRPDLIHRARLVEIGWETESGAPIFAGGVVPSPWTAVPVLVLVMCRRRRRAG